MGTPFSASSVDREFMTEICKRTPELMTTYGIKANLRNGLEGILQGWDDMKVSLLPIDIIQADHGTT
jgi:hypothetical protein